MKKIFKNLSCVLTALLVAVFSFGKVGFNVSASSYSLTDGISFTANEYYEVTKKLEVMPQTFEAEILIPSIDGRIGCVFSNYDSGLDSCISLDIVDGGKVCLYYDTANGYTWNRVVDRDLRTGDWVHLTVVNDQEKNEFNCYIDGVKVDTAISSTYADDILVNFIIGGDNRPGNSSYFKGRIRSLALYSDVRTEAEILSDMNNGADANDANAIAVYDMPATSAKTDLVDLTGNGYNVNYGEAFYSDKEPVTNYAYSFAAVGDTQNITEDEPEKLEIIYNWLVANKDSKKIAHVFGLGDITDMTTEAEWETAQNAVGKLNGVIPYSLVRGNHDTSYMYNKAFATEAYTSQFGGFFEDGGIENSWKTFTAGSTDYLAITLDFGASDEVLAWASRIIEAFPTHKVIITTHAYMYADGTTVGEGDEVVPADSTDANYRPLYGYNDGDAIWDKLISQHANIFLVMSGHISCNNIVSVQRKGVHGNTVTQMLIDPQDLDKAIGAVGLVAMLYFSEDGNFIDVEYYSTVKNAYFKETNQFRVSIADKDVKTHSEGNLSFDEQSHWYSCSDCGRVIRNAHVLGDWVIVKDAKPGEAGEKRQSCDCGYYVSEEIPALPVEGDSSSDSSDENSSVEGGEDSSDFVEDSSIVESDSNGGGSSAPSSVKGCSAVVGSSVGSAAFALLCISLLAVVMKKRG